jgi:hypothetical protein
VRFIFASSRKKIYFLLRSIFLFANFSVRFEKQQRDYDFFATRGKIFHWDIDKEKLKHIEGCLSPSV